MRTILHMGFTDFQLSLFFTEVTESTTHAATVRAAIAKLDESLLII